MNANRLIGGVAVALLAVGCGFSIKTSTDYDRSVRFPIYDSFFIIKGNSSGNSLIDERAQEDVRSALLTKAWIEVPEGMGKAAVVVHAATTTKHTYETLYEGWGGWGWQRGLGRDFGGATTVVDNYEVGTLVVDIFDSQTKQAIWHGTASDAVSDNAKSNAEATRQAVEKMFKHFPPASATESGL
jgi:hypothetical protein